MRGSGRGKLLRIIADSPYRAFADNHDYVFIEYHADRIKYHFIERHMFLTSPVIVFDSIMIPYEIEMSNSANIIEGCALRCLCRSY